MSNLWERFDDIVKPDEVLEAKTSYAPLLAGDYVACLEKFEASENKDGLPMLKGQFRTESNRVLFYNQNLQNLNYPALTAKNVAVANDFVNAITGEDVDFTTLGELADRVEKVVVGDWYTVNVSYGKKDLEEKFPILKIVEPTATVEGEAGVEEDEDTPF